jgi:hypothetical protein
MNETAPFVITHHNEASSWYDSPVLKSLIGMTVAITTRDGIVFDGVLESINADENSYFSIANLNADDSWGVVTLNPAHISKIHYC